MKPKTPDSFRVHVNGVYCSLNLGFHELGCLIPDAAKDTCHVFTNLNAANHAVDRTVAVAAEVRRSMIPDFKPLQPLLFNGELVIERFEPTPTSAHV